MVCHSFFKENVTVSFVSPLPSKNHPSGLPLIDAGKMCEENDTHDDKSSSSSTNYASNDRFPNNLLRNVARRASNTEFVLVIDIDMLPSENLRQVGRAHNFPTLS